MIQEDVKKNMLTSREGEAKAQKSYEEQANALRAKSKALRDKIDELDDLDAKLGVKKVGVEGEKENTEGELGSEEAHKKNLDDVKCEWISSTFEERQTKRKVEMEALQSAKDFLAKSTEGLR